MSDSKQPKRSAAGWDRERERAAETSAEKSRKGRDIAGDMPEVADPARKEQGRASLEYFCRTYFGETFNLPWSSDHRKMIARIEEAVLQGGLFAYAMPRGSGKTSLAVTAAAWATLYGLRQFPMVIGSDESAATGLLESIKSELENNPLLYEDFPEVCHAIRKLEGIAHRANGQLFNGERTHIGWTAKELILPTIPGSAASGACIRVKGITGGFRGQNVKRPDGKTVRPDLVIVDDPQTDESAKSPTQSAERERILAGAVLGLAGPGKKISGIMPCTVIAPDDMADRILDRQKNPEWQGERTKMLVSLPKNDTLWQTYEKLRGDSLRAGNGGREATEFYGANREAMDEGAEASWPVRHNADELSAVQHAMNLKIANARAFFAEYQNEPQRDDAEAREYLTADEIAAKLSGRPRGTVPAEATKLTAFVDIHKEILFWCLVAYEDDFTGYVVDYGTFPDQRRDYFAVPDVKRAMASALKAKSTEEAIYQGLLACTGNLLGVEWPREDKTFVRVDKCLVDANWGPFTDVVYRFCRESPHAATLLPTHGKYIGAASGRFNEHRPKPGELYGDAWIVPIPQNKRTVRYGRFDTNHWKTFTQERLAVPIGGAGCLSLFGDDAKEHRMFADHLTSETGVKVTAKERTVTEWKNHLRKENHYLDCLVGCNVAASMLRVSLAERKQGAVKRPAAVSFADARKNRTVHKGNRHG